MVHKVGVGSIKSAFARFGCQAGEDVEVDVAGPNRTDRLGVLEAAGLKIAEYGGVLVGGGVELIVEGIVDDGVGEEGDDVDDGVLIGLLP